MPLLGEQSAKTYPFLFLFIFLHRSHVCAYPADIELTLQTVTFPYSNFSCVIEPEPSAELSARKERPLGHKVPHTNAELYSLLLDGLLWQLSLICTSNPTCRGKLADCTHLQIFLDKFFLDKCPCSKTSMLVFSKDTHL